MFQEGISLYVGLKAEMASNVRRRDQDNEKVLKSGSGMEYQDLKRPCSLIGKVCGRAYLNLVVG